MENRNSIRCSQGCCWLNSLHSYIGSNTAARFSLFAAFFREVIFSEWAGHRRCGAPPTHRKSSWSCLFNSSTFTWLTLGHLEDSLFFFHMQNFIRDVSLKSQAKSRNKLLKRQEVRVRGEVVAGLYSVVERFHKTFLAAMARFSVMHGKRCQQILVTCKQNCQTCLILYT